MTKETTFYSFIFRNKKNRNFLLIALLAIIVEFILFKCSYPFADFFSDSYSYIYAAQANLDINIWPIGYSKFLRAFHFITSSDTALVAFQYLLLEISGLYLFFTLRYFYNISGKTTIAMFVFLFFNPLLLYVSNYVNSDPLFIALSLFWITHLLWVIQKPQVNQIFIQALLLFLCFTVRNNAYYYPIITALAFVLAKQKLWRKLLGATLGVIVIIPFVLYERNAAYKMTGTKQFSLFTGWQLANNALYMYGNISVDSTIFSSNEARELNRISAKFYSKVPPDFSDYLFAYVANYFIRQPESPLKQYIRLHYKSHSEYEGVVNWGKASVVFSEFGNRLIKNNPISYARHFMSINTVNYLLPPLEKMEIYNLGDNKVDEIARDWFKYKTVRVYSISSKTQGTILSLFPSLFMLLNIYSIGGIIFFLVKREKNDTSRIYNNTIILITTFLILNAGFCIFATIIVIRYEIFPMVICFAFSLLLAEWLDKIGIMKKRETIQYKEEMNHKFL